MSTGYTVENPKWVVRCSGYYARDAKIAEYHQQIDDGVITLEDPMDDEHDGYREATTRWPYKNWPFNKWMRLIAGPLLCTGKAEIFIEGIFDAGAIQTSFSHSRYGSTHASVSIDKEALTCEAGAKLAAIRAILDREPDDDA